MCFFGKRKYVAAISCLKRANYLEPCNWRILYNLGLVHLTMQQFASAFHFLSASINLNPTRGQTFGLLAVVLTYLDDKENTRAAYEQALTHDTRDPAIALNNAIFLYNNGDLKDAIDKLQVFEARVANIKQAGLQPDPDVVKTALNLCIQMEYSSTVLEDCKRKFPRTVYSICPLRKEKLRLKVISILVL